MSLKLPANLPQASELTKMFLQPEIQFENMAKQSGLALPKGPQSILLNMQRSMEAGKTPEPPAMESLNLPGNLQLPNLTQLTPFGGKTSDSGTSTGEVATRSNKAREPHVAAVRVRRADEAAVF